MFLPEVPLGVNPITRTLTRSPKSDIAKQIIDQLNSGNLMSCLNPKINTIVANGYKITGKKLLCLKNQFPLLSNSSTKDISVNFN